MNAFRYLRLLGPVMLVMLIGTGCSNNKEEITGSLDFGMAAVEESALKGMDDYHRGVAAALVTIRDEAGSIVYEKKRLEFFSFGNSFVTSSLELKIGEYQLTEFFLVDTLGEVTWATPVEDSPLAHMVDDPVPIWFYIEAEQTTHVHPQVIRVGNHNPDDFGYVDFHVDFVERFCLLIDYESPCMDWTVQPDDSGDSSDVVWPIQPAMLKVFAGDGLIAMASLVPGLNKVAVPRGYQKYRLAVQDCGTVCYRETFRAEELLKHACYDGEPIYIACQPGPSDIIITPEEIKTPTIEQGIFGQVGESGYYTDEFIPVVRDIYLYHHPGSDSLIYILGDIDCYFYPEIAFEPVAIVRSNTSGYFQLPMEEGTYLYMVETEQGYYIDMYLSSRIPGKVKVYPGKVTELNIAIIPCM